jgi:hypothetical protein
MYYRGLRSKYSIILNQFKKIDCKKEISTMLKMVKMLAIVATACIALLFSGCMKLDVSVNLTESGQDSMKYVVVAESTDGTVTAPPVADDEVINWKGKEIMRSSVDYSTYKENGVEYVKMTATTNFDASIRDKASELDTYYESINQVLPQMFTHKKKDGYWELSLKTEDSSASNSSLVEESYSTVDLDTLFSASDFEMNMSVKVEGEIISTNGVRQQDGSILWSTKNGSYAVDGPVGVWKVSDKFIKNNFIDVEGLVEEEERQTVGDDDFSTKPVETPVAGFEKFRDVRVSDKYYDQLKWAFGYGVLTGVTDTEIKPNDSVTREQAVALLNRYNNILNGDSDFVVVMFEPVADVSSSRWSYRNIQWGIQNGVVNGTGTTSKGEITFDPTGNITDEQFKVMLYNYLNSEGVLDLDYYTTTFEKDYELFYKDKGVSSWAKTPVILFDNIKFYKGDYTSQIERYNNDSSDNGDFKYYPKKFVTRAEFVAGLNMIHDFISDYEMDLYKSDSYHN